MKRIMIHLAIELIAFALLLAALPEWAAPLPLLIVGLLAAYDAIRLIRGPRETVAPVERTHDEDRDDKPVEGSRVGPLKVEWNDVHPLAVELNKTPEGTVVRVRYYPSPFGHGLLESIERVP